MKRIILAITMALSLVSFNAFAADAASTSSATTSSSANGGIGVGSQGQALSIDGHNTYEGTNMPVNTAFAPSMNPTAPCALTAAGGVSFMGFSGTAGGSTINEECQTQEIAKTAFVMGERDAAREVMCGLKQYRAAQKRLGRLCLEDVQAAPAPQASAAPAAQQSSPVAGYNGNDPFVIQRLQAKK